MKRLALVPARGGSKRLPRKNIVLFSGHPIICHTIEAALATGLFDKVLVSTEDQEIAEIAAHAGAEVLARPAQLATDTARVTQVCEHALDHEEHAGLVYDAMTCLLATAALRTSDDIVAVTSLLDDVPCDFAMAVTSFPLPPHQALRPNPDGSLTPMWPNLIECRTDELPTLVVDNGSTYAVKVPAFRRSRSFYGPGLQGHVMPPERSVDIDERADLRLAQFYAGSLHV